MQFKTTPLAGPEAFPDPLDYAAHPIGKLRALGDIITAMACNSGNVSLEDIDKESIYGFGEIITDAVADLELIIDTAMGITPKKAGGDTDATS